MTPRKARGGRPNHNNQHHLNNNQHTGVPQISDYESDTAYYFSDAQQQQQHQQQLAQPTPASRSNEELNIAVLRRHNPAIHSILSLAPYTVVYIFSPVTQQWEKSGVEGSMFVCQLVQGPSGEERYGVFVLNRRGLNNFDIRLTDGENVEITDEYVILKTDEANGETAIGGPVDDDDEDDDEAASSRIYGLWIYSEPAPNSTAETRTINAQVIKECAVHAGESLKLARERVAAAEQQNGQQQRRHQLHQSVPMGRQISLKELFGQQRAQDDGWSVRVHSPGSAIPPPEQHGMFWGTAAPPPSLGGGEPIPTAPVPGMMMMMGPPPPPPPARGDVLGDLFRRAGLTHQG
jgi:hypothetical protein